MDCGEDRLIGGYQRVLLERRAHGCKLCLQRIGTGCTPRLHESAHRGYVDIGNRGDATCTAKAQGIEQMRFVAWKYFESRERLQHGTSIVPITRTILD